MLITYQIQLALVILICMLMILSCTTVIANYREEVERVSDWMAVNRLKLNVTKSVCMLIGSQQRVAGKDLCLSLHDSILKQVSSAKYLGVFIDQHLTWRSHIDYVLRRVRGKIYSINHIILILQLQNYDIKINFCLL